MAVYGDLPEWLKIGGRVRDKSEMKQRGTGQIAKIEDGDPPKVKVKWEDDGRIEGLVDVSELEPI